MAVTSVANLPGSIRNFYSREILRASQPKIRFAQFAKKKNDLLKNSGDSIKFTKYSSLANGGTLTEGTAMTENAMSSTEISIAVTEYGNATAVSEKALQLSLHDELREAAIALANDMAKVLDKALRDAALSTTNQLYGGGHVLASSLTAGDGLTTTLVKDAVEQLDTNNAPKIDGEYYICIAHPHQLRQIRDDSAWINAHTYSNVGDIYVGEVGMYEGVRFIATTQMPALDAADSTTAYGVAADTPTWEAVIFGENAYGWAEALPVEMRDNGVTDYGRVHGLAWYAIWGFGLVEEANVFSLLTA